ncbi:MAG TPA: aminotransferase class I/II-fold pyridoxal phosphate-dependent enzyme [Pirellulales bacterium]|jgi:aspartate aminotransferase/aminotransferase|nr:aminotransferase class I/II-fold pyridoxal phosphate-dependent enzyme [Pirellulales bacterium]
MHSWLSSRSVAFDSSGIRKVFDLAAKMKDPINLSIGQPDFDVPEPARRAMVEAVENRKNGYSQTQGIAPLLEKLQTQLATQYKHADRKVFVTSGTSGGLLLVMMALVNPGDEVILFDPYFVTYEPLVKLMGGRAVLIDTYPHFTLDLDQVRAAITPRTKAILFDSPANPTGVVATPAEVEGLAKLAAERNIALISDEIYSTFCYLPSSTGSGSGEGAGFVSPAKFNPQTIVVEGFSKTFAMTGWRVGFAHGPAAVIDEMMKLQQYTFVCAPQPAQWACVTALGLDMQVHIDAYRYKRDMLIEGLRGVYEIAQPEGAFYIFPKVPESSGAKSASEFVERAIENQLLIIPGKIFSSRDTHFRISYAAENRTIERGIEVLLKLAK